MKPPPARSLLRVFNVLSNHAGKRHGVFSPARRLGTISAPKRAPTSSVKTPRIGFIAPNSVAFIGHHTIAHQRAALSTQTTASAPIKLLEAPPPFLFFTGKGGVGKTSLACACALELVGRGKKVLLVSTDPASNLGEMLDTELGNAPKDVNGVPGLKAMNLDPDSAAEEYRIRVIDQMGPRATADEIATVREQLSGACTTEVAVFDEFAGLLADHPIEKYDHVVFDTAPTGHTLRLLSLPAQWSGFLQGNDRGASCLGPHSGLKMAEDRFRRAVKALGNTENTRIVLVARPDKASLTEADRTRHELKELGLSNQWLIMNGVFDGDPEGDRVAAAFKEQQQAAIQDMPEGLTELARDVVGLKSFDTVGLDAIRALLNETVEPTSPPDPSPPTIPQGINPLSQLISQLATRETGLIMVLGKGGVGKTTIAASIAVALASRGLPVHLSTTDPAAHLDGVLGGGELPSLRVDKIDPKVETARYVDKMMATKGRNLDDAAKALMLEDLKSPCTEEVAVFHAFSRIVAEARSGFVVLDTAPTGHTLLLMDATGAYHRQVSRELAPGVSPSQIKTPLTRLQDPKYTRVLLVTLPETTPVSEASALQSDLRRAKIEPFAWIINRSLAASGTGHRLLKSRIVGEVGQMERVLGGLAKQAFLVPWRVEAPVGVTALKQLAEFEGQETAGR